MKNLNKNIVAILIGATIGVLTVFTPMLLSAESTDTSSSSSPKSSSDCRIALKPFIAKEEKSFREFISQTLKNKSDTSNLIEILTERYRVYRMKLLKKLDGLTTSPKEDLSISLRQALECKGMTDNSLAITEALLRKTVIDNAQAKKTTKLVKKLKDLNDKLGKLQREIGTLKGYNDAFRDKLPCFTSKCVR